MYVKYTQKWTRVVFSDRRLTKKLRTQTEYIYTEKSRSHHHANAVWFCAPTEYGKSYSDVRICVRFDYYRYSCK